MFAPNQSMTISYAYPSQKPLLAMQQTATRDVPPQEHAAAEGGLFGEDGFTFKDILDVINPLQQLPIIGSIYRGITGDTISAASRMAGGAILGGPIGFISAAINSAVEGATGKDLAENVFAMISAPNSNEIKLAANKYAAAAKLG